MGDHDAKRAEDYAYNQSLHDPHCTYPSCPEASDPQTHSHCECGEMVSRSAAHSRCPNCLAIEARIEVRFALSFNIGGRVSKVESRRDVPVGPDDADRAIAEFARRLKRETDKARQTGMAWAERPERVDNVNRLLVLISTHERHFFGALNRVASFGIGDDDARLRYMDERLGRVFLMVGATTTAPSSFSHGGGLWRFVLALRDYIEHATPLEPDFGEHWGYNADRLAEIRAFALELGIADKSDEAMPF